MPALRYPPSIPGLSNRMTRRDIVLHLEHILGTGLDDRLG